MTPENLTGLAELVCQEFNSNSEMYRTDLSNIDGQITDTTRRLERLYDVIETGEISLDDVGPRIRALRERYEKLQSRKEELNVLVAEQTLEVPTLEEVRECAADLRNSLERGSLAERKAFIRGFVKEVRIAGDEAKLTYTLPMLPRGLREETESVLAIVQHGGPPCTIRRTFELAFCLTI